MFVRLLLAGLTLGFAAPALAQAPILTTGYKEELETCLAADDYPCGLDVLINFARDSGAKIAVSRAQGPTLLGSQLFTVLDEARNHMTPQQYMTATEQVLNFVLDQQPDSGIASAPFVLLMAEACLAVDDIDCVRTASQPLQLMMQTDQFYIKGNAEDPTKPDTDARALALLNEYAKLVN